MKRLLFAVFLFLSGVLHLYAPPPTWWSKPATKIVDDGSDEDNYAPANLGQLKHVAKNAKAYLDTSLPGGAGESITWLVDEFEPRADQGYTQQQLDDFIKDNYSPINLGQLKAIAKPFYDRLLQAGYDTKANLIARGYPANWAYDYPWDPQTPVSENYAPANLGQLKLVFSFDLEAVAPVVRLASPLDGTKFALGESVILAANLSWSSGNLEKVEFYNGATKIGESLAVPYRFVWEPQGIGTYTLTAKAIGSLFPPATSSPVTITVEERSVVQITEPTPDTIIAEGADITITAVPSSPEGPIQKVEFFDGDLKIGEASAAPYTIQYTNIAAGKHLLVARLIYRVDRPDLTPAFMDLSVFSRTVALVAAGTPAVSIVEPQDATVVPMGSDITIEAAPTVTDGLSVARVEFFEGSTKIGESEEFPFSVVLSNVSAGEHEITATVIDSYGSSATSQPVTFKANSAPTVSITSPMDGAVPQSGTSLEIEVSASDPDGTISNIEIYDNGSRLATNIHTPPYKHTISNLTPGAHEFVAVATDNDGATTFSPAIAVFGNQAPTISISSPSSGAKVVVGGTLEVTVSAQTNIGLIEKIEIYDGETLLGEAIGNRFVWKDVPVGVHSLKAKATSTTGAFALSAAVEVTAVERPQVTLSASTTSGVVLPGSALTLTTQASSSAGGAIQVNLLDGAVVLGSSSVSPYVYSVSSIEAGMHSYVARVTDSNGTSHSNVVLINATGVASSGSPHGNPANPPPEPGGGGNRPYTDPDPVSINTSYSPTLSVSGKYDASGYNPRIAVVTLSQPFPGTTETVLEMKTSNGPWTVVPSTTMGNHRTWHVQVAGGISYQFRAYGKRGGFQTKYTNVAAYHIEVSPWISVKSRGVYLYNPGYSEFEPSMPSKHYLQYEFKHQGNYSYSSARGSSSYSASLFKTQVLDPKRWIKIMMSESPDWDAIPKCYRSTGTASAQGSSTYQDPQDGRVESSSSESAYLDADGFWNVNYSYSSHRRGVSSSGSGGYRDIYYDPVMLVGDPEAEYTYSSSSTYRTGQWTGEGSFESWEEQVSSEYSEEFFDDVLDNLKNTKYSEWSHDWYFDYAPVGYIDINEERDRISASEYTYKVQSYPASNTQIKWYEIFESAEDSSNIRIVKQRAYTPSGAPITQEGYTESQDFDVSLKTSSQGQLKSGRYYILLGAKVNAYGGGGVWLDNSMKASGGEVTNEQEGSFSINVEYGGTYTLSWTGNAFTVIDTRVGHAVSSGYTITWEDYNNGTKGASFRVVPNGGAATGDEFSLSMSASFKGASLGSDSFNLVYKAKPVEPDEDQRDYTVPADYASGTRYRKIALNGRPLADEKPQSAEETDEAKEETYVDAMTLGLRHSTTDVYVPVSGSPLILAARRNTVSENWNMRGGLRPHERPDRPFGVGWSSNLSPSVEIVSASKHPDYAYVTDENGSVHRFVWQKPGGWVPMPTSSIEAADYLTRFDGSTFTGKYGNKIEFEYTSIYLQISADREMGSNQTETHSYRRATRVTDRFGKRLDYSYSNSYTLIPATISLAGSPGQTLYIAQNNAGLVTKIWDPNGNKYEFSYDFKNYISGNRPFSVATLASVKGPDGGITRYGYNLAVEADLTPREPGDPAVPKYHCDVDRIEDPLQNVYSFTYSFDHSKQTYSTKHGYYSQTGMPRNVASVTLPGSAGTATFQNHSLIAVAYGSNMANLLPSLTAGSRCATQVTDAVGSTTTYDFSNGSVFKVNVDSYTAETSSPKIVYFTTMTIGHSNGGTEVFTFNPEAGMALQSAQDLSGNTTTFAYNDTWAAFTGYRDAFAITGFNSRYEDPTSQTNPLGHTKTFTYGTQWRIMSSIIDEEGRKTEYTLNSLGQRTAEIIKDSSGATVQQTDFVYGNAKFPGVVTRKTVQRFTGDPVWASDLVTTYALDTAGRIASETVDPGGLNLTTNYTYDLNGNKLSATDPNGNTTWFDYDGRSRLAWVTYPDNNDKHLEYDLRGNKIRETDENGHITTFGYDALNRLTSITKSDGAGQSIVTQTGYNAVGSKTSVTDPNGNVATMEYDTIQRLTKTTTPAGITTYEYGTNSGGSAFDTSAFKPTKSTDPRGYIANVTYDALYRPVTSSVEYKTGVFATTTSAYDKVGNLISQTDPLSKITATEFDALNRPVKVTYADNKFVTSAYTATGLKWKVTDELGRETETEYDRAGRAIKVKNPVLTGSQRPETQTLYDNAGNIIGLINPLGKQWDYTLDNRNRKVSETAPEVYDAENDINSRPISRWAYDAVGNVIGVTDAKGNRTDTTYDAVNRPIQIQAPAVLDPSDNTSKRPTTTTTYDANGNVLSVTDPNGHVTTNVYDALNRLTSTTDAANITVSYEYDAAGNRTKVTDGRNHATLFEYDGLNRNTRITNVASQSTVFAYNAVNKISRTDAKGQLTSYTYDDRHRLKTVSYSLDSTGNQTYSYDHAGNLLSVVEPGKGTKADVAYSYDALNRVVSEASSGATHQYEYDLAGNRLKTTYGGSSLEILSTYDALNRLSTMVENGRTTTYRYDLNGKVVEKELPGDTLTEMTYDALGRLESITESVNGNDLSQTYQEYDLASNVTTVEEEYFSGSLSNRTVKNSYDSANRLIEEAVDLGSTGTIDITTSYVYDAGNNRTQKSVTGGSNAGVTTYTVNTLDQITTLTAPSGTVTYTYDTNGNRITRTKGTQSDTYTYDGENRLIALGKTIPDPGLSTGAFAYTYDYRTRRVERDESGAGGNTTRIVFSGGLSSYEEEGGTRTVEYIRGSDYGGGVGGVLYTLRSNVPSYNHYNNRGDVVAKTDGTGTLTYQAQYEAFGNRLEESGSTPDRQKMNTKDEDSTGLVNHGFRYFDLETEGWLTRDPVGFVDGPNLYAYVRQNPWTKFDPEGLAESSTSGNGTVQKEGKAAHKEFQEVRGGKETRLGTSAKDVRTDALVVTETEVRTNELKPASRLKNPSKLKQAEAQLAKQMAAAEKTIAKEKAVIGELWAWSKVDGKFVFKKVSEVGSKIGRVGKHLPGVLKVIGVGVAVAEFNSDAEAKGVKEAARTQYYRFSSVTGNTPEEENVSNRNSSQSFSNFLSTGHWENDQQRQTRESPPE